MNFDKCCCCIPLNAGSHILGIICLIECVYYMLDIILSLAYGAELAIDCIACGFTLIAFIAYCRSLKNPTREGKMQWARTYLICFLLFPWLIYIIQLSYYIHFYNNYWDPYFPALICPYYEYGVYWCVSEGLGLFLMATVPLIQNLFTIYFYKCLESYAKLDMEMQIVYGAGNPVLYQQPVYQQPMYQQPMY